MAKQSIETETIFALASAPGRAGVAVMRVSGPKSGAVLQALTCRRRPEPRRASLRVLYNETGERIDEALVLWFPGPGSFTGEDMAELHTHGSAAVLSALAEALSDLGLRQARAGEFTRRAFENGRMDLTEVEGLADLIDAESEAQRLQALRQMRGGLKAVYEGWRHKILDALAMVEGEIDFPDEEGVPDALAHRAGPILSDLGAEMAQALAESGRGEQVRSGLDIAIIGAPNAGKSSLLNRLARREAAIVTAQAGTTRDIIEVHLHMGGQAVRLADTAGLRETGDIIEAEGVRRALARAEEADLRIAVIDSVDPDLSVLEKLRQGDVVVWNKIDLARPEQQNVSRETFLLSSQTGEGFAAFEQKLEALIKQRFQPGEGAGLTRARHKRCVEAARSAIDRAYTALSQAPELAGDDLRQALEAIRELAGEADIEAVLDRVFSQFCIGK